MPEKNKNSLIGFILVAIIVSGAIGYTFLNNENINNPLFPTPTPVPTNQPTAQPTAIPTISPTPQPTFIPTPTPTITITPTPTTQESAYVYQTAQITYTDGSTPYWYYPENPTVIQSMAVLDNANSGKSVSTIYAAVYFGVTSQKTLTKITMNLDMNLAIFNEDKTMRYDFGWTNDVYKEFTGVSSNSQILFTSSSATPQFLNNGNPNIGSSYYYVITLRNVEINTYYNDGTSKYFEFHQQQAQENQLWWHYKYVYLPYSSITQIEHLDIVSGWTNELNTFNSIFPILLAAFGIIFVSYLYKKIKNKKSQ